MGKLNIYGDAPPDDSDKLLGVDVSDVTDDPAGSTKSFLFSSVWNWVLAKFNATAADVSFSDTNGTILLATQVTPTQDKILYVDSNGSPLSGADQVAVRTIPIEVVLGGAGAVITTGIKVDVQIPKAGTITKVTMLADQSGSLVVDIWKDSYANFPPTVADTITAAAKPTISAAVKSEDVTLTGWTVAVASGDILRFNVDSAATITRCTIILELELT